ncbi:MAG: hypothetical protein JW944_07685, partial [Deltaproteobacteria bacterium]|nr:hypothetical protein [Deltaproteobacteria bacterium]
VSDDQWQYILDMELWDRGRVDFKETFQWLDRFHKSDPERLAQWLYSEDGNLLAHLFFDSALEVRIKEEQDYIPPEGFFTFDNLYYINILDKENEEVIEQMLRQLASEDYNKFQALLLGLGGMVPAEVEEEMYRMKGVRLAEDGYLPFEEAISVYSYQSPDLLKKGGSDYSLSFPDEETGALVPLTPLSYALGDNIFSRSIEKISDSASFERLRLEFAGLCNQIFSADAVIPEGIEDLVRVTEKASGYLSVGLEMLSGNDIEISGDFIRNNPLVSIFRVGFGTTLELKWKVEKRIKDSWFIKNGLDEGFWGDEWGGMLKGILMKRPLFYQGDFRPFEGLSEVKIAGDILNRLLLLDKLMGNISDLFGLQKDQFKDPLLTFHAILFHSWAVRKLYPDGAFAPLSIEKTREFFNLIRKNETTPPYKLKDYRDVFVGDCLSLAGEIDHEDKTVLHEALSGLWEEFAEEYAMVDLAALDPRFTKYIIMADKT